MSTLIKVLIGLGVAAFFVIVTVVMLTGKYNYAVSTENQIEAIWENNQNILSQYSLKVKEIAKVPDMYKDDLKEVMTSALSARYGENGSQATFQWLKEHNVTIDSAMYTKIQQAVEAGRNKFENAQTKLVDVKQGYKNNLDYAVTGTVLKFMGFPKSDLAKFEVIKSNHAVEAFKTGIDKGVDF
jgi:hypothetical protein